MPGHVYICPDKQDAQEQINTSTGVQLIMVLLSISCMMPYQWENYQRVANVWGPAYKHQEDGHWLMVYQGECPTDWEWEEAQTTI